MAIAAENTVHASWRENLQFLRGLVANPSGVSSVFPSSPALARAIAAQVDPSIPGTVLELGPGTGAVTRALLARGIQPSRLKLIERDDRFVDMLRKNFAGVTVEQGDALDIRGIHKELEGPLAAIVSGLPLLNFPLIVRRQLLEDALTWLPPGAPFVQLSFGMSPPVPSGVRWDVRRAGVILRNIPPARVWVYTRD
jgi:phosphatidylethanolamine/phosphatidyl-N-methylethanolamine N-methyltransferase